MRGETDSSTGPGSSRMTNSHQLFLKDNSRSRQDEIGIVLHVRRCINLPSQKLPIAVRIASADPALSMRVSAVLYMQISSRTRNRGLARSRVNHTLFAQALSLYLHKSPHIC